eukprot:7575309-Alexandrium_andersonii.AAC.1
MSHEPLSRAPERQSWRACACSVAKPASALVRPAWPEVSCRDASGVIRSRVRQAGSRMPCPIVSSSHLPGC